MYSQTSYRITHEDADGIYYPTLLHALANLPQYPGAKIVASERDITLELKDVDEVICDMLRNRASRYRIEPWYTEPDEVCFGDEEIICCTTQKAMDWLIKNVEIVEAARYHFDRTEMCGKYIIECDAGSYGFCLTEID